MTYGFMLSLPTLQEIRCNMYVCYELLTTLKVCGCSKTKRCINFHWATVYDRGNYSQSQILTCEKNSVSTTETLICLKL